MNLTPKFKKLANQSRLGFYKYLPKNATDFIYFLVPGFFTDKFGEKYMEDNINHLSKLKLDVRKLKIDSGAGVEKNADIIKNYILAEKKEKKIIIIGHSKGGIDAATAIAKYDLYEYIKAVIFLQTPWYGSHFSNIIDSGVIIRTMNNLFSFFFNTESTAIFDLKHEEREKMLKKYYFDIQKVNTICFSSIIGEKDSLSLLYVLSKILKEKYNLESDGIVTRKDSIISGSNYIVIEDFDHGDSVLLNEERKNESSITYYPGDVMYALLVLAIKDN